MRARDDSGFATAIARLASELPLGSLQSLAAGASHVSRPGLGLPAPSGRSVHWACPITLPDQRQFLDDWQTRAPDTEPAAVGVALLTASAALDLQHREASAELVWTGPDAGDAAMRRTDQALLEVINSADQSLLIVSFAVYRIESVSEAVVRAHGRGADVRICLETPAASEGGIGYDTVQALGPDMPRVSTILVWPQDKRPISSNGQRGLLHAKVAVADSKVLFLSSANLTEYAMTLNIELGVLIRGGPLPRRVVAQFDRLVERGVLRCLNIAERL